jgi:hypothetical protein
MFEINWDYNFQVDGIIDTGIIVIAHFENPIQDKMLKLLKDIFGGKKRILIPLTTFVCYFPLVDQKNVIEGIDIASINKIESWDGYLMSLARLFQTSTIYSVDKKLKNKTQMNIIIPVSDSSMEDYHKFLNETIFKKSK